MAAKRVIFVNNMYILVNSINKTVYKFLFACLLLKKDIQEITQDIFFAIYNSIIEIKKKKSLSIFHKVVSIPL